MMKTCSLCHTEMPTRYNYCYQCGEYVGNTDSLPVDIDPEDARTHQRQERVIHYGCMTLLIVWSIFGLWFCVHINH